MHHCVTDQSPDETCEKHETQHASSMRSARPEHVADIWLRPGVPNLWSGDAKVFQVVRE